MNSLHRDAEMRLLIVQYAGDYREAAYRFARGEGETYYAQKYSVDAVAELSKHAAQVTTLCCLTDEPYDELLPNGVHAVGAGFSQDIDIPKLLQLIEKQRPTHLILRTPIRAVLQWTIQNKIRAIAILADSFSTKGLKDKFRNYLLSTLLNHNQIEWIFNHGVNSCRSLQTIGVNPNKIIPWDWLPTITPDAFPAKQLQTNSGCWNLLYVGSVIESKGVGDSLEALSHLKAQNLPARLTIAGGGDLAHFKAKAKSLNIENSVEFLGLVPNHSIIHLMRDADLVLIPSRHDYPEGFPMTIYEAFCSRTPIVASNHPMFKGQLKNGTNAMIFPAGNSSALAQSVKTILSNSSLYQTISVASYDAWNHLQIPVKWADILYRWLDPTPENQQWLFEHRLTSGKYALMSA